ncbi:MAG: ferredoxin--NADP reductase [Candidatus Hodgkinia cicadicola]|nr:MAG: ferredoxin--NADP reductase [Candidatus Hodgkinia cicadicola]
MSTSYHQTNGRALDHIQNVVGVTHYTNKLFSFKTTRPKALSFKAGEFVMIGLVIKNKPVFRAYSICSAIWQSWLEFYSIKVVNGPFTSFLQKLTPKSSIIVKAKATGTLTLSGLKPGKRLFLLGTGTGIAPFISIMLDPETYEVFEEVIVVLACRLVAELQYLLEKHQQIVADSQLKPMTKNRIRMYTSVTRDSHPFTGRITTLITSGVLTDDLNMKGLDESDRFMICGSQAMIADTACVLKSLKFKEGSASDPQSFVYEKAFAS